METRLQAGHLRNCDSVPSRARNFSVLQSFQTSSGAYLTFCSMIGMSGSSPKGKPAGKYSWPLAPSSAEVKNAKLRTPVLHNTGPFDLAACALPAWNLWFLVADIFHSWHARHGCGCLLPNTLPLPLQHDTLWHIFVNISAPVLGCVNVC
jgi:hypothetical protein